MAHSGGTEDTAGVETFADVAAMDAWLTAHAGLGAGVWVKVAKKGTGLVSVGAADVNDVALCHGWITGHRKGYDDAWFLQRITPRRPGSMWSAVNVRRVEELTAAGRMRPAGHAEVAAAGRTAGGRPPMPRRRRPRSPTTWPRRWRSTRAP